MAQVIIRPNRPIEIATIEEIAELFQPGEKVSRIRVPASVKLDANGNGQDEVYTVPAGMRFETRRVVLTLTGNQPADPNVGAVPLGGSTPTPAQTPVVASATGAASAMNVSLPAAAGVTNFITGFEVTGGGATAGSILSVTVTGAAGGTLRYALVVPAGAGVSITPLIVEFPQPIAANGPGIAITLSVPSFGAGNTNANASIHGFTQGALAALVTGSWVAYLRSGSLIEYGQPAYGSALQVPGIQSWGAEQGPQLNNKEVFEILARGLTPNVNLNAYVEGILSGPRSS